MSNDLDLDALQATVTYIGPGRFRYEMKERGGDDGPGRGAIWFVPDADPECEYIISDDCDETAARAVVAAGNAALPLVAEVRRLRSERDEALATAARLDALESRTASLLMQTGAALRGVAADDPEAAGTEADIQGIVTRARDVRARLDATLPARPAAEIERLVAAVIREATAWSALPVNPEALIPPELVPLLRAVAALVGGGAKLAVPSQLREVDAHELPERGRALAPEADHEADVRPDGAVDEVAGGVEVREDGVVGGHAKSIAATPPTRKENLALLAALATPAPVPADMAALLREHVAAHAMMGHEDDTSDDAVVRMHDATEAIVAWTRANLPTLPTAPQAAAPSTVGALFAGDFDVIEFDAAPYIVRWRQMGWTSIGFATRQWHDDHWTAWESEPAALLKVEAKYPARRVSFADADAPPDSRGPITPPTPSAPGDAR